MKYEDLRLYQKKICDQIPQCLKIGSVLVYCPPRSGKSKMIAHTALRAITKGLPVLVLTHRDKILRQLIEHCNGIAIDADTEHLFIQPGKCYVAMNQSLLKRPNILSQLVKFDSKLLLLVDEAHRNDFSKTMDIIPTKLKSGFTGSPAYKWAKHLPKYYPEFIHGPQISELTAQGNITPIDYYEMRSDLAELKKGSNGEYTEASQFATFDKAKLYDGLFDELAKFQFTKAIVFCASKKAAESLLLQFLAHNYKAITYYSGKAKYELAKFTDLNMANVMITVSALAEGFDHPPIDFNIIWRATSSLPLFIQLAMRGATPYPTKLRTTVLDFGGNNTRFGGRANVNALTMDRDWYALSRPPEVPPKTGGGISQIKICPACEFMLSASVRSCSNCGYIYPEAELLLKQGELMKILHDEEVAKQVVQNMSGRRISTLTPTELAAYAIQRNKKPFCARVAKRQEQLTPGFLEQYQEAMGYKAGWAAWQLKNMGSEKIEYFDILIK